jgi:hypothetical protein
VANRLNALRGEGEDYSDVIARLGVVGHASLDGSGRATLTPIFYSSFVSVL